MSNSNIVVNPVCSYHVEGLREYPEGCQTVLSMYGEDSGNSEVRFTDPDTLGALAELLWEAAVDLFQAQTAGIESLGEIKGTQNDDDFSVENILNGESPSNGKIDNPYNSREDIRYPWEDDDE